jgi:hypothetical protein
MPTPPASRSVKISDDERGGWSSDRPRREGTPNRPVDISVRCRVLQASDRQRYSPGSLLVIVSPSQAVATKFVDRLIDDKNALLSLQKVRGLLEGRVAPEQVEEQAAKILEGAVRKRLDADQTVVVVADSLDPAERETYVRIAHGLRRPRHLILVEAGRDQVAPEDLAALNELRSALDGGWLGDEGFQTALRLGGATIAELRKIVFRPPPRDDD